MSPSKYKIELNAIESRNTTSSKGQQKDRYRLMTYSNNVPYQRVPERPVKVDVIVLNDVLIGTIGHII